MKRAILSFVLFFTTFSLFFANEAASKTELSEISSDYLTFNQVCSRLNAKSFFDPLSGNVSFQKNGNFISFNINDEILVLNYKYFKPFKKSIIQNGNLYIHSSIIEEAQILFSQNNSDKHFKVGAILIDPGHGGKDPGTIGYITKNGKKQAVYEKNIVLTIAKELNQKLTELYPDKKILMTRSTDVFLTLEERVEIANNVKLKENEAIIYISIHANSAFNAEASGFEVWYLSPGYRRSVLTEEDADAELLPILNSMLEEEYTTESILIAKFIHDGIQKNVGTLSKSRGLKAEEWFVCRNANMPSVLIEVGFVSNKNEVQLLSSNDYLKKITMGIYNGVESFVTHFEQSRGFTSFQ